MSESPAIHPIDERADAPAVEEIAGPVGLPASEEPETTELRGRLRAREKPSHVGADTLAFLASLAAFVWFMRDSGPLVVAVVVGVLVLHEAGHFVAMRALGYENVRVFFVPFFGAALTGRPSRPGEWRAAVVSLAGPVPGILLGAALAAFAGQVGLVRVVVLTLVFVNGLNLLPFVPLDGGRLMNAVLFSRHRVLELGGMVAGAVGLVAVPGLLPEPFYLWTGVLIGALVAGLLQRNRVLTAAARLRTSALSFSGRASELPAPSLTALSRAAQDLQSKNPFATERTHTSTVIALHQAAATRPARWPHAVGLFAVYVAAALLAVGTYEGLEHPTPHWELARGPGAAWSTKFPAPPSLQTTLVEQAARYAGWRVTSAVTALIRGRPSLRVSWQPAGGQAVHATYEATGHVIHALVTSGPVSPGERATFVDSFTTGG